VGNLESPKLFFGALRNKATQEGQLFSPSLIASIYLQELE